MSLTKVSTVASAVLALAVLGLQLPTNAQSHPRRESPTAAALKTDIPRKNASTHGPLVLPVVSSKVPRFVSRQRSPAL
jgi:hypothetical protein